MPLIAPRLRPGLAWGSAWLAVLATLIGYLQYSLYDPVQTARIKTLLLVSLGINAVAWLVHALQRRIPLPVAVAAAWAVAALYQAGLAASTAMLLMTACSIGIGSLLMQEADEPGGLLATLTGLAIAVSIASWLLPFPLHRRLFYCLAAGLVIVARAGAIHSALNKGTRAFSDAVSESRWASFAAINVVGACSTPLWLPTMQADDISYHLAMPFQLQELGYYRMDVATSIWAVAPWASDLVQGIGQVLSDGEARGAINLGWMLLLYTGMWRLSRVLGLPTLLAWTAIALHASLPLTSSLLAGMQTELPSSALLVVLATTIAEPGPMSGRRLTGIAAIAGLLLAVKLSNGLLIAPMGIWLLVKTRLSLPWRSIPCAALLGAFVALPSYFYAWLVTGNPVLPFLNGIFISPYFTPENWKDEMWMQPVSWLLPWQLTFQTSRYLTGIDGAAGFAYLLCVPGLIAALFQPRLRGLAAVGIACFGLVFLQIHFVRYTHPATALLIISALGGLSVLGIHRGLTAAVTVLCTLNLSLFGAGYWQIRDGALEAVLHGGREYTLRTFAAQRIVAGRIRQQSDADTRVLFHNVDANGNAELTIPAYTTSWYDWKLVFAAGAADADPSGKLWRRLLEERGITLLVVSGDKISAALKSALATGAMLDSRLSQGDLQTWHIAPLPPEPLRLQPIEITQEHATYGYLQPEPGSRVSTYARFHCNLPNEPIVISIAAQRAGGAGQQNLISGWAMCSTDGIAEGTVTAQFPADTSGLVFIAWPRSQMDFDMVDSRSEAQAPAPFKPTDPAREMRQRLRALIQAGPDT